MATFVQNPGWGDDDRPHVLIEAAEWGYRHSLARVLDRQGFATATCPGPEGADARCPLANGGECQAASEADVVVHALRSDDLRGMHRRPDTDGTPLARQRAPSTPGLTGGSADGGASPASVGYAIGGIRGGVGVLVVGASYRGW